MSLYTFLYKGQVYDTVTVDNAASAVHSSDAEVAGGPPPAASALVAEFLPLAALAAVDKSFNSVQLVPFQTSVFAKSPDPENPPKQRACV